MHGDFVFHTVALISVPILLSWQMISVLSAASVVLNNGVTWVVPSVVQTSQALL